MDNGLDCDHSVSHSVREDDLMPVAPDYIRDAARRALEDRQSVPPSRRAGTPVGLARANQLARGDNLSIDTLKRMVSFIARHRKNYTDAKAAGLDNKTSKVIQAMNLWGGVHAQAWAQIEIEKAEKG